MTTGFCKLCKIEKQLCKKSHILPKHTYNILKKDGYSLRIDKNTINQATKQKDYSGIFEQNILCGDCEGIFNKYETYANNLIYRNKISSINIENVDNKIVISGDGYDYKKIKLYFLSILWRSSISSNSFFDQVKLANNVEEELRGMFLDDVHGVDYPIDIILALPNLIHDDGFNSQDVLITEKPYKKEINCLDAYVFLITGQSVYYIIGESSLNTIKKDSMTIFLKNKKETLKQREQRFQIIENFYEN